MTNYKVVYSETTPDRKTRRQSPPKPRPPPRKDSSNIEHEDVSPIGVYDARVKTSPWKVPVYTKFGAAKSEVAASGIADFVKKAVGVEPSEVDLSIKELVQNFADADKAMKKYRLAKKAFKDAEAELKPFSNYYTEDMNIPNIHWDEIKTFWTSNPDVAKKITLKAYVQKKFKTASASEVTASGKHNSKKDAYTNALKVYEKLLAS